MQTIITIAELKDLDNYILFDCRFALADANYGQTAYQQSHIPGALYFDLEKDLSGRIIKGTTGRHPLPSRGDFSEKVRRSGLMNDQQAVIYDDSNGAFAARMWWMLRWLGHSRVAGVDGGFNAWTISGGPVTDSEQALEPSDFKISNELTSTISADEIADFDGVITDARDVERFRGNSEPIDPIAGHIPNASCLPFTNNLTADQTFKPVELLKKQFLEMGVPESEPIVCYCGSGVTAAHNILALVHAGFPEPILYPGSWSEWITDPERPVATND